MNCCTHPLLEHGNLFVGKGIGLGDYWDQVDFGMKSAHDLDIQRLQGMPSRLNKVYACMDTIVDDIHAVHLVLCIEIGIEALFNVLDNRAPRIIVVDKIAETWSVDNRQAKANPILLNVRTDGLNRDGLWNDIKARSFALLGG